MPHSSARSMLGNSVAVNHRRFDVAHHCSFWNRYCSICEMAISRDSSSDLTSLVTRSRLAGATLELLTMPNPFGVSTRSSDGTARISASCATTLQAVILSGSFSSMAMRAPANSSPMNCKESQRSAASSHGSTFSKNGASPSTVAKALGRYLRNCSSFFMICVSIPHLY